MKRKSRDVSRERDRRPRREDDRRRSTSRRRRSSRSRSTERRKYRDRDRSRDRDRDRDRESDRSRDKERERERERDKEKEREAKEKLEAQKKLDSYQADYEKEEKRIQNETKDIELRRQQEIDDLTKDQRTIFVGQLTMKVHEENLREFFSQIGIVKNIIMIRDKSTGKHKGFGYVEMQDLESIPNCLLFNNVVPDFQKFPILVKASEAEKNFLAKKDTLAKSTLANGEIPDCRVYLGNIHVNINEDALRLLCEQFGPVDSITLHRDEMGNSKGFAFIRYRSHENAQMAMTGLAGVEVVGRALKVGPVLDNSGKTMASNALNLGGSSLGNHLLAPGGMLPNTGDVVNWKLDDDDGSKGMSFNSQSRQMLMAKLGQAAGIQVPVNVPTVPAPVANPSAVIPPIGGLPSRSFLIVNMFDPRTESEPNWDQDIRDDVFDECRKYGVVENVYVDKYKPEGLVYVKFTSIESALKSAQQLNGRFFAGKMITVTFIDPTLFDSVVMRK